MNPDSLLIPTEVVSWVEQLAGCPIKSVARVTGGLSRKAYSIELTCANQLGSMSVFLMLQGPIDNGGNRRDAQVLMLLENERVMTPRVIAYNQELEALLMEKLEGQAEFSMVVDASTRRLVSEDLMLNLARLHAVMPDRDIAGDQAAPASAREAAVNILQPIIDSCRADPALVDPFCEFCLAWLWSNLPSCDTKLGLVHGDIGPGNFLFQNGKVTGIVDWELAHIGDPMEDLARLYIRSMSVPMGNLATMMEVYQAFSGTIVDRNRIAYYIVLTLLKSIMLIRQALHGSADTVEAPQKYMYEAFLMRAAVDVLLAVNDVQPPPEVEPEPAVAPDSEKLIACDMLIHEISKHLQPVVKDSWASERLDWALRLAEFLKRSERLDPAFKALELRDLESLAQRPFENLEQAQEHVLELIREWQAEDLPQLLVYFSRQVNRICCLRKDLLGNLFNNRIEL